MKFVQVHQVLDGRMKQLTATGVAMVKKQAQPLTPAAAQEDLWENKSSQLIKQIVFSTLYFGITASVLDFAEAVKADSWMLISIPLTTYDENGRYLSLIGKSFKNYQGGLEQHNVQNKDLRIYSMPELGTCGVVHLFSKYMAHIHVLGHSIDDQ